VWAAVGDGPGRLTCTALIRSDGSDWQEIDPMWGTEVPLRAAGPAEGPPDPPDACPECGTARAWQTTTSNRVNEQTGATTPVLRWHGVCAGDEGHPSQHGRRLSTKERVDENFKGPGCTHRV